jgi:deazaflavin-dependent oxidoreductase (nitroreductase family)
MFWRLHRAAYRLTLGRFGLSQPAAGRRFGMMRLATVGRRSGKPRVAIIGYYEDGPNLITLAMNGWGEADPAWWLNLQANPDTLVGLADGPRAVRARASSGPERDRLWARFRQFPGWGDDIDALAARRSRETAVVVLEPRNDHGDRLLEADVAADPDRADRTPGLPTAAAAMPTDPDRRRRLRLRHLWIIPGLAIAVFASRQAEHLGLGIVPLLAFTLAPDFPRLLGLGQPHAHGQMAARAVPAFNLMHHPGLPLAVLLLAPTGIVPPLLWVGALAWLGHLVIGLGIGDRMRGRDGFLRPLWPYGGRATRNAVAGRRQASSAAEIAA